MSTPEPKKSVTVSRKTVTTTEANHEVEPRESQDRQGARPLPATTTRAGAAAHALLDDAAGQQKSETEEALERATEDDTKSS